jgi:hypothetical protein
MWKKVWNWLGYGLPNKLNRYLLVDDVKRFEYMAKMYSRKTVHCTKRYERAYARLKLWDEKGEMLPREPWERG